MTPDQIVNGWNLVFVVAGFFAAVFIARDVKRKPFSLRDADTRALVGVALILVGLVVRIGGWLPWRAFREAGRPDLVVWYADLATYWTTAGALFCYVGLVFVFHGPLQKRFGRWTAGVVLAALIATYTVGAKATWLFARLL